MKKLAIIFAIAMLASCSQAELLEVQRVDAPWGSVGLPEGWSVKSQEGSSLVLESQLEELTQVAFRDVRMPDDLDGWAKSFIESSGRTLDRSQTMEISGRTFSRYDMTALAGKIPIGEMLVLIPVGDRLLAVNAMWQAKSVLGDVPRQIVKSVRLGGQ